VRAIQRRICGSTEIDQQTLSVSVEIDIGSLLSDCSKKLELMETEISSPTSLSA